MNASNEPTNNLKTQPPCDTNKHSTTTSQTPPPPHTHTKKQYCTNQKTNKNNPFTCTHHALTCLTHKPANDPTPHATHAPRTHTNRIKPLNPMLHPFNIANPHMANNHRRHNVARNSPEKTETLTKIHSWPTTHTKINRLSLSTSHSTDQCLNDAIINTTIRHKQTHLPHQQDRKNLDSACATSVTTDQTNPSLTNRLTRKQQSTEDLNNRPTKHTPCILTPINQSANHWILVTRKLRPTQHYRRCRTKAHHQDSFNSNGHNEHNALLQIANTPITNPGH
mmetsp:Transcript_27064/g.79995  ORF Transcript_27064/g.79995 Transcript_27064/m.79995 type:complete len:280 (-) Transcript_27064:557-1396(-)